MDRLPPFDQIGVTPVPDFINADPGSGVRGSIINGLIFNALQRELVNLIGAAGFTPSTTDLTQVLQAVARGGIWLGSFGGTANGLTGTIPNSVQIPAMQAGMRVRGTAGADNTGGVTLSIAGIGGSMPIVYAVKRADGSTCQAGDIKNGQTYSFDYDGTNFRLPGASSGGGTGGFANVLFTATKGSDQSLSNGVFTDITWTGSAPSFASWNGTALTAIVACRLLVYVNIPLSIGVSGGNYSEAACSINLVGADASEGQMLINGGGGSGTQYPYVQAMFLANLAIGDVLKIRASANAPSYFTSAAARGTAQTVFRVLQLS